jgi:hypothetical protein
MINDQTSALMAELVDAPDLRKIECPCGNARSRTAQIRGNLCPVKGRGNREPSPRNWEGVETKRVAPKAFRQR